MRRLYALKRFIMMWVFAVMILGAFAAAHAATASVPSLVVKMAAGLTPDQQAAVVARNGGVETTAIPALRMHVISIQSGDPALVLQKYQTDPEVERAELNKTRKSEGLPSDTHYGVQWALTKIGWDSVFGSAVPTGSAKVAILDTGIDASHPDLHANVIDGTSILDNSSGGSDSNGHGTSLAGIVAAVTNNELGIAGLGFSGVQIMPVTVLDASGIGQDSDIIKGVIWAADQGADVILMGFSNADFSQNLQDAIDYAWEKGAVLVAATGNDGASTPTFPAGARGVVGVSSTNEDDALAFGSNYGQDTFLAAPGTNVYTTEAGGSYTYITGTSASSAMVAGAAALIKAVDPALTNGVIVGRLAKSAAAVGTAGDPANPSYFGNGRLDLAAAVASTSTESVQPAGAAPVGNGGPFVGPYSAAANTVISMIPAKGPAGTSVTFSGSGFKKSDSIAQVTFMQNRVAVADAVLNKACLTDADGKIANCSFTVPAISAGSYSVRVKDQAGNNSAGTDFQVTGNLTVSVAISGGPFPYDGKPHQATVATTPSVGYSVRYSSSSPSYDSTNPPTEAGTYNVAVTITDPSYVVSGSSTGTLKIDKASATISVSDYSGKYDGSAHGATGSAKGVQGEDLKPLLDLGDSFTNVPGGTAQWSFAGDNNYLPASGTAAVTITKADAVIVPTGYSGTYDGYSHSASGTATGVQGEDLTALLQFGSNFTNAPGGDQTWSFKGNNNYEASSGKAPVAITPAKATVSVEGFSGKYDGSAHGATGSAKGVQGEDLSRYLNLGNSFTNVPGGQAEWSFAGNPNYAEASGSVNVSIAKASATVTLSGLSQTYTGSPKSVTATTSPSGKKVDITYDKVAAAPTNAGSYAVAATINDTNFEGSTGGTFTINKANATVTLSGTSQAYDGSPKAVTATTNPAGKTVDITYNGSPNAPTSVGSYAVNATINDTNYKGTASGTLNILTVLPAPASISVPASNASGTITVSWTGTGYSGLSFVLEYKTDKDPTWRQVYSGIYNYTSMSVGNATYSFRVKETKSGYADSPYKYSTTDCRVLLACDPPTYVTAPATSSTGSVTVSWGGGNVSGLTYQLQYKNGTGPWTDAYTGTYNYANLNLPDGKYQFQVRSAKDGYVTSGYTLSSTTCEVDLACGAPTKVTVPATSTRNVSVSWTGGTVSGATYKLQYKKSDGTWTDAYTGSYNYTVVTVPTSGTYTFQVQATKSGYDPSGWTESTACAVSP